MKYLEGNILINGLVIGLSDLAATFGMRLMQYRRNTKPILQMAFITVLLSALQFLFIDMYYPYQYLVSIFGMWFGATLAFNASYYSNIDFFPSDLLSTSYGIANTTCRVMAILAPLVAEGVSQPSIIFIIVGALMCIVCTILKEESAK